MDLYGNLYICNKKSYDQSVYIGMVKFKKKINFVKQSYKSITAGMPLYA